VGITADVTETAPSNPPGGAARLRTTCPLTYAQAVANAGGVPVLLPPIEALAAQHAAACDAFVLTGGDDPTMEAFGVPTHPKATPMHPARQAYELALLRALDEVRHRPVLGVCLGMQLMSLHHGGTLNQRLEETHPTHAEHVADNPHAVRRVVPGCPLPPEGRAASNHRQAVSAAGRLRVVAVAHDGVIEAVDDPARRFYLGVQWHPERTADPALGPGLFAALLAAVRAV
jgi:putative glutamine amidotransferase